MRMCRLVPAMVLAASLVGLVASARAASHDEWVLGVWEGTHLMNPPMPVDRTRFEFYRDGSRIKWRMHRVGRRSDADTVQEWEASGTVTRVTETEVDLAGKYDRVTTSLQTLGKPITYWLQRAADTLVGTGHGATNPFRVEVKRKP